MIEEKIKCLMINMGAVPDCQWKCNKRKQCSQLLVRFTQRAYKHMENKRVMGHSKSLTCIFFNKAWSNVAYD